MEPSGKEIVERDPIGDQRVDVASALTEKVDRGGEVFVVDVAE